MRIIIRILFVFLLILISSCKQPWEPEDPNRQLVESTLPVSDSAAVPDINAGVGIETGAVSIIWSSCNNANKYELEQTNIGGGWELVYSGTDLGYGVGVIPDGVSISFRVRAVYSTVVSRWSRIITP